MPIMLAEAGASTFNISATLDSLKSIVVWGFDIIKAEPIMALGFVGGIALSMFGQSAHTLKGLSR